MILVSNLRSGTNCLDLLHPLGARSNVNVDLVPSVQNVTITFVHRSQSKRYLSYANIFRTLDLEEALLAGGIRFDLVETALYSARSIANPTGEVAQE